MPEAARRAGVSRSSIKRSLENEGFTLVQINERAFAVEEADLAAYIEKRGRNPGAGRPPGAKNKMPRDRGAGPDAAS